MEALLCDEDWLSSSAEIHIEPHHAKKHGGFTKSLTSSICITTKEDIEEAIAVCMEKEMSYMPEPHYKEFLESKNLVFLRLRCIQWFLKCRSRWDLSHGTVFLAANYLDRFISKNRCKEWKDWMVELLGIACLSVACKFHESYPPTLSEIQMEGEVEEDEFDDGRSIERMEMILLEALEWRLCCPTAYSYIKILGWKLEAEVEEKITELLIEAVLLDYRLLAFTPTLIALSTIWFCLDHLLPPITSQPSDSHLSYFITLFNQHHHKDEMMKCRMVMEAVQSSRCPQSPTSVLMKSREKTTNTKFSQN